MKYISNNNIYNEEKKMLDAEARGQDTRVAE